ncbi:flagellar biosynthetic protein FliR [Nocardioides terrae]|uniref:Flagellar biosynthetic protein FliR n=1 Tax=Nocardioides terrae TaxID=574651 RepID=A0A1I1IB67_9ACTN|nr:flagellar biosynthetic protein FliR [Nocardioides terrae]SFC33251.1 flagellar biosynthetic protein FliR [Nocardioides terrae]
MTITVQGAPLMAFLLASVRIVAWLAVVPPFSSKAVPSMAKIVIALGLSFVVAPSLAEGRLPSSTPELLMVVVTQVAVGLGMGFVTMLLFSAVSTAGALIDVFGGFALAAAFDPLSMNQNTIFGSWHQWLATALLLVSGGHLLVIGGLLETFSFLPLTGTPDFAGWQPVLITAFQMFFTVAVQIALPLIAVLFLADLALALLTKVAPQLSAINIMYPAKIGMTLLLVGLSFPVLPHAVDRLVDYSLQAMSTMSGAS